MTSLFDDYLTSQPGKPREADVLYITDLTKPCLRQAYLDIARAPAMPERIEAPSVSGGAERRRRPVD